VTSPTIRFSAVVLAAGLSSRMAGPHKMMLRVGDEPAIRRSVRAVLDSGVQEVVVVTGYQGREVMSALSDLPVALQPNIRYEEGQMTSVAAGVAGLTRATDAIMVCLGDMVLITAEDLRELMAVYEAHSDFSIVAPRYRGERGNPILFAAAYAPEVAAGRRLIGCRKLIQEYPDETYFHDVTHDRYSTDMDTPADYVRVLARLGLARAGGAT
jgi:molybdenum cofactor cytidylyltransferase